MTFWEKTCRFILTKVMGWTIDSGCAPTDKAVLLGVPHTSIMDFLVSYFYYRSTGQKARVMIKREIFAGPLKWLLPKLGGVPVDRTNAAAVTKSVIDQMNSAKVFHLAIAPEGTRKAVKRWKAGYHTIAKGAGCPVYMAYFDWGTKHVGMIDTPVELTDDARADTERIQQMYEQMHLVGRHPDRYITH